MHARIENGQVVEFPIYNLQDRLPNTSLPLSWTNDATLPDGFVYIHPGEQPEYDQYTQTIVMGDPVQQPDGRWVLTYTVQQLPPDHVASLLEGRIETAKTQRRMAYQTESDPLFFKWQRGEATKEEWLAKTQEIKERFPF